MKKTHISSFGLSFIAISANPLSYSISSGTRRRHKTDSSVMPAFSTRKNGSFRSRRVYATRSESNQDVSSSSSVVVQSAVVGCHIEHDKKILLCKRNIEPTHGLWTLPAGYMEIGESAAEGAIRETWEEAGADVELISPFAQLDTPRIGQTYVIFLAKMKKPQFSPCPESSVPAFRS